MRVIRLGLSDVGERGDSSGLPGGGRGGFGSGSAGSRRNRMFRRRRRFCTYRREEGAAPLLPAPEETGETRRLFLMQGTLSKKIHVCSANRMISFISLFTRLLRLKSESGSLYPLLNLQAQHKSFRLVLYSFKSLMCVFDAISSNIIA